MSPSGSSPSRSSSSGGRSGEATNRNALARWPRSRKVRRWRCRKAASAARARVRRMTAVAVRDLDLDLDAFEGPFDLLLTLVLKDELELGDVEVAGVVAAFLTAKNAAHFPRQEQEL